MMRYLPLVLLCLLCATVALGEEFYVSTSGEDDPANGSEQNPFRSLSYALSVADTTPAVSNTIHVGAGTYTIETEILPLPMIDDVIISGAGPQATVFTADDGPTNVFTCVGADNWTLENLTITGGNAIQGGGISMLQCSHVNLRNLIIRNNRADHPQIPNFEGHGGGLYVYESDLVLIDHVLLYDNSARDDGGALSIVHCNPALSFVTITRNSADLDDGSAAIFYQTLDGGPWTLENSIVWANGDSSNGLATTVTTAGVTVSYSLVERADGAAWGGTGNVWNDPLFTDPENDFTLLHGSPAIDLANPAEDYTDEPAPNGDRANSGFYGNTDDAQLGMVPIVLSRGQYAFIGLPVETTTGDPQTLFGEYFDNTTPGEDTWRLERWDNTTGLYLRYDEVESDGSDHGDPPVMAPGLGYLVQQNMDIQTTLWVDGNALDQSVDYTLELATSDMVQMHMIANPYPYPVNWSDMCFQSQAGLLCFDDAAQLNYADRYLYILDSQGRFVPTLDRLDPWQGAFILTHREGNLTWIVPSERNEANPGDLRDNLDWGLSAGFSALDASGETMAADEGHLFGTGELMEDGRDGYDACVLNPLEMRILTWSAIGDDESTMLYHDLREPIPEHDIKGWHFHTMYVPTGEAGDTLLPESFLFRVNGFAFDDLGEPQYPDTSYRFRLMDSEFTILMSDMRDYPDTTGCVYEVTAQHSGDTLATADVWVFAGNQVWADADETPAELPSRFEVTGTWPNPFNRTLSLSFTLPQRGDVAITVFDVLGREVDRLQYAGLAAGAHRVAWQPEATLASGIYFIRLKHAGHMALRKAVLVK